MKALILIAVMVLANIVAAPYAIATPSEAKAETDATAVNAGALNLNSASKNQLQELKGIGEVKAQAIIDYRDAYGDFTSVEELLEVDGIGPATLANIKQHVAVPKT